MFGRQAPSDISDSETHELATRMSALERGMNRLVNAQLNDSRVRWFARSGMIPDGTKTATLQPPTNNSVLLNTLLIVTGATPGNVTIQIGPDILPVITSLTNQTYFLNLGEEVWPLGNTDKIQVTTANPVALYVMASGKQRGDAYLVG